MTPYYERDGITIYHGDAREILPTMDSSSVDLLLADPPYPDLKGGYERGPGGVGTKHIKSISVSGELWESNLLWIPEAWRVARLGMMVFCTYHSVAEVGLLVPQDARIGLLTWYKRNAAPTGSNVPRHTTELIWMFRKRPGIKWDTITTTMLDIPNINAGIMATERLVDRNKRALHPTQKPLALMHTIMLPGADTILDPFMGTGTTLLAAKNLGRRAIGIELDEQHCETAVKRLQQSVLSLEAS